MSWKCLRPSRTMNIVISDYKFMKYKVTLIYRLPVRHVHIRMCFLLIKQIRVRYLFLIKSIPIFVALISLPFSDVTWTLKRLKTPETLLFVQQLTQSNDKEDINVQHHWSPIICLHKGSGVLAVLVGRWARWVGWGTVTGIRSCDHKNSINRYFLPVTFCSNLMQCSLSCSSIPGHEMDIKCCTCHDKKSAERWKTMVQMTHIIKRLRCKGNFLWIMNYDEKIFSQMAASFPLPVDKMHKCIWKSWQSSALYLYTTNNQLFMFGIYAMASITLLFKSLIIMTAAAFWIHFRMIILIFLCNHIECTVLNCLSTAYHRARIITCIQTP